MSPSFSIRLIRIEKIAVLLQVLSWFNVQQIDQEAILVTSDATKRVTITAAFIGHKVQQLPKTQTVTAQSITLIIQWGVTRFQHHICKSRNKYKMLIKRLSRILLRKSLLRRSARKFNMQEKI